MEEQPPKPEPETTPVVVSVSPQPTPVQSRMPGGLLGTPAGRLVLAGMAVVVLLAGISGGYYVLARHTRRKPTLLSVSPVSPLSTQRSVGPTPAPASSSGSTGAGGVNPAAPSPAPSPAPASSPSPTSAPSPTPSPTPAPSPSPTPPATLPAPNGYTNLIFDDTFSGTSLNTSRWIGQIADKNGIWDDNGKLPYPYSSVGNQGGYNAEYGSPDQVVVNNGLTLNAARSTTFSGYTWKAGYITTHGKFTFSKGYFQVRAKLPDSRTGGWAGIWFLEGGGEIDMDESGYTACGSAVNNCIASNLNVSGNSQKFYNAGVDLSTGYHVYGMEYKPGKSITMYFDGKQTAQYTANIPTGAYTIILTETMAQNASGWHTLVSGSTPSPMSPYQISEAQVWQ
ncbi:MAG TPA: hypothetical protein VFT53_01660 [Candidatus Saccharimonadales bacterium]|nr:hypothetical protein [Candidatus Saccharimonadales bacterium]